MKKLNYRILMLFITLATLMSASCDKKPKMTEEEKKCGSVQKTV